jgi:hypothetical protein
MSISWEGSHGLPHTHGILPEYVILVPMKAEDVHAKNMRHIIHVYIQQCLHVAHDTYGCDLRILRFLQLEACFLFLVLRSKSTEGHSVETDDRLRKV